METIINEIETLIDIVRGLHPTKVIEEPKKRIKRVKEVKVYPFTIIRSTKCFIRIVNCVELMGMFSVPTYLTFVSR